jgi:DNA-binding IclR family transcriptional regulator
MRLQLTPRQFDTDMLMRTQASVALRAHKSVHRLRRASIRTFNLKVSALDQVWCVTSMSLSITTNKELVFA